MTNEELNTALYHKMFAEQERFKAYLLTVSPHEVLEQAYEYVCREDILLALENNDLSSKQAMALMKSDTPLADVFQKWEEWETGHMGGYSIYGSALDGSDPCVRLECYMQDEKGGTDGWKIERCYMKESEREMIEIMAGPFFICDCSGESFGRLNDDQLKKYTELFKLPERFTRINDEIVAVPYTPNKNHVR